MISRLLRLLRGRKFRSSASYWDQRYREGGNSGPGSYAHLAQFKADVLNDFVARQSVHSVVEFGCGDGNQLTLAQYPDYTGYDVSPRAVEICREKFAHDPSKRFETVDSFDGRRADLSLSLDVIFHLVEDAVFDDYMRRLFAAGGRFVGIYASNAERSLQPEAPHVKHRKFSDWIDAHAPEWELFEHVPNRFPDDGDFRTTSFAEFFFYRRRAG
ncbi:Sulfotransferase [Lysobacter dokdonensis DS-58]|uniref:Sulfotransferase n=1 Tax=Lysobacter dokdonensis DS-58 TaxID=1300345 RepID=A0A0A2WGC0_9GAMM|nr:class I SAM-dependent methyltransferase [Lysobacter dokdonensis]KGQ18848.1 Sulfotransferase [Lysobacter dokdonensis DS-58]